MPKKKTERTEDDEIVTEDDGVNDESLLQESQNKIKKVKGQLEAALKEKREYLDGWQRARADLLNIRKQFELEKQSVTQFATQKLILDVLGVLDSFDMAFANKDAWERVDVNWRRGIEYIYQQFLSILQSYGVETFNPIGEKFNPESHESIATLETDKQEEDNTVVKVSSPGYRLHGKVIRPAKVHVAQYK